MFNIGLGELILILALALILIGPKQLPEVARTVGKLLAELKSFSNQLTKTIIETKDIAEKELNEIKEAVVSPLTEAQKVVSSKVDDEIKKIKEMLSTGDNRKS